MTSPNHAAKLAEALEPFARASMRTIGWAYDAESDVRGYSGVVRARDFRRASQALSDYRASLESGEGDGWIEWRGGECPVGDDTRIEVKFRSGITSHYAQPWLLSWKWDHQSRSSDIIAYRLTPNPGA